MTEHWKRLDEERKEWPMPRRYRNFTVKVSNILLMAEVSIICLLGTLSGLS